MARAGELIINVIPVRAEVRQFSEGMERKLRLNEHKGGSAAWRQMGYWELFDRLQDEAWELYRAIQGGEDITDEAADVANFAMMISDKYESEKGPAQ